MMHTNYTVKESPPSVEDFASLRKLIGWSNPCLSVVQKSIDASLFWATIYLDNNFVGCGRVIGDGAMYFYIQDIIVAPSYQKQGIGHLVMTHIENYLSSTSSNGATIALLSAHGKENFYTQYGYVKRDGDSLGFGMCKFISK